MPSGRPFRLDVGRSRRAFMSASLRDLRVVGCSGFCALSLCACATNPFSSLSSSDTQPPARRATGSGNAGLDPARRGRRPLGLWRLSQGSGSRAHRSGGPRPMRPAGRDQSRAQRRGDDVPRRQRAIAGAHLKGSPSGKNYVGPPGPAGGTQDREIVAFDGRTMVLRWMDPEDCRPLRHRRLCALRA